MFSAELEKISSSSVGRFDRRDRRIFCSFASQFFLISSRFADIFSLWFCGVNSDVLRR